MDTLFDPAAYQRMLGRLESLTPSAPRQWGKMTVAQMLEHTARALEMAAGKKPAQQALIGKLIAWAFRGDFVGPKPFGKDSPTGPNFIVQGEPEFGAARERLKGLMGEFHALGERGCEGHIHSFFGRMTGMEWGVTQHKHLDHHFRQFGA